MKTFLKILAVGSALVVSMSSIAIADGDLDSDQATILALDVAFEAEDAIINDTNETNKTVAQADSIEP